MRRAFLVLLSVTVLCAFSAGCGSKGGQAGGGGTATEKTGGGADKNQQLEIAKAFLEVNQKRLQDCMRAIKEEGDNCGCGTRIEAVEYASEIYFAEKGRYPSSLDELIDSGYLEGPASLYECPWGGTVTYDFKGGQEEPEGFCSVHGSP